MNPTEIPEICDVMQKDRHRLIQLRRKLSANSPAADRDRFLQLLAKSQLQFSQRRQSVPQFVLDESLPIFQRVGDIRNAISENRVVIISGETGSGKSTQLPLIALQAGLGVRGLIGHTQPRRIAARSVADRMAQQLGTPLGNEIGFKIRFTDQSSERTLVKVMTDGILLAETQSDRFLDQYELLIIDEAHERSLNIDFVLGIIKSVLPKRPDLKVIITSATIDTQRFAEFFSDSTGQPAPVLHVEGRTFPVDIEYLSEAEASDEQSVHDRVVDACRSLVGQGDILAFLPTEIDIRIVAKKLRGGLNGASVEILPLYARLSPAQQTEVFRPHSRSRIVLATNVAESSITVPGIRFVIDTGTARISRYAPRTKVQRLPIEGISQASANQRAGRCGRVGPGICLRLYSRSDFDSRPAFTTAEIRRTNLAGTILQLLSLGYADVEQFPFLDPPSSEHVRDGFKTLFEIQAIDEHRRLTPLGKRLARLPVDPRVGRMLIAADENHCLNAMLILASGLEVQDPRVRPAERQAAADQAHQQWNDPQSDFVAMLKLWDFIEHLKETLSRNKFRLALEQNFLSHTLVLQWHDIHRQLLSLANENGMKAQRRADDYSAIHRALLTGLLSGVALLEGKNEYTGAGGTKFVLWPGSGVFKSTPKWIVAAEILETTRRYGRTVAAIEPTWAASLAEHLVKRTQVDPFWSAKSQSVMAYQNTALFGLPLVSRERVNFTRIDPVASRRIFIDDGLIANQVRTDFDFHLHNQMFLEDVDKLAHKTRERKLIIDSYQLAQFYHQRLPAEAVDVRSLQELLRKDPDLGQRLQLDWGTLGIEEEVAERAREFPDQVRVGNVELPVDYQFQPGTEIDGPNIRLPLEALGQLDDAQLSWLIPGLIGDRIEALIRSLPKNLRRNLVPAPDVAARVASQITRGQGHLQDAVARELSKIAGEPIAAKAFDQSKIGPNLHVNVLVVDGESQVVAQGRSVTEIQSHLGPQHRSQHLPDVEPQWNQTKMTDWSWGNLPEVVRIQRGGTWIEAFPAIFDEETSVALRLVNSRERAQEVTTAGLTRLLLMKNKKQVRSQVQWLPDLERQKVNLSRWLKSEGLVEWLSLRIVSMKLVEGQPFPRSLAEFDDRNRRATEMISIATQEIAPWISKLGTTALQAALDLEKLNDKFGSAKGDIKEQFRFLFSPEILASTPWRWIQHFPRYLAAISVRVQKLPMMSRDQEQVIQKTILKFLDAFNQLHSFHEQQGWSNPELRDLRWMIEEFRVSQYAQQLGTSLSVSEKRLEKQLTLCQSSYPSRK